MTPPSTIKIFIIDDSLLFHRFLAKFLPMENPHIQIAGSALNPFEALTKLPDADPDVLILDVAMPGIDGITFLGNLLPKYPLPVILVSSLNVNVFDALCKGAVEFVKKPDMSNGNSVGGFVQTLAAKIFIASRAKIPQPNVLPATTTCVKQTVDNPEVIPSFSFKAAKNSPSSQHLIALGASTGGTEATLEILRKLPMDIPGMVIAQHMPEGFTSMYAQRLDRLCPMEIREARNGDLIRPGLVLIAPGGKQQTKVVLTKNQYRIRCYPAEKVNGHRPSVDVLFHSAATAAKNRSIGVLLTGMGRDGAEGLLHMHKLGAYTVGQDRASCVVYGMPREACLIGALSVQAPCQDIARLLINYLKK